MSIRLEEEDQEQEQEQNEQKAPPLLDKMLKTRTILISGEINKELAERVVRQLIILETENDEPIHVFIDSPGGDADAGYAIFDMIRFVKPEVFTADKEHRVATPNSHYLIHQPLSGMRGVATDIEIHAREIERMKARINNLISEETGQDLKKVEKDTDRDFWMNAEEAKEYGLVSKIVFKREELSQ